MTKILLVYSTSDGHTLKICHFLKQVFKNEDHQVELVSIDNVGHIELMQFDTIVIGASIRYGKHSPQIYQFIGRNLPVLESKINAFFSVDLVRENRIKLACTNPYVKKFVSKSDGSSLKVAGTLCRKN